MTEKTIKERMYNEISKLKKEEPIQIVGLARSIDCSVSYLSSLLRYAQEAGFVGIHESGDYMVLETLPETYREFQTGVNKKYENYRKKISPRKYSKRKKNEIPEDFELNEETIVPVITSILEKNKELKEKNSKYKRLMAKLLKERKELLEEISAIPID